MMRYSENGFWVQPVANGYRIGLSAKGQDDLGEVSYVELVSTKVISTQEAFIMVEASKAVTDLTAPLDEGEIIAIHTELEHHPELLNSSNPDENWIVVVKGDLEAEYWALNETDGLSQHCKA